MTLIIWDSVFFFFPGQGPCLGAQTHMGSRLLAPWTLDCHSHQLWTSNTYPSRSPCLAALHGYPLEWPGLL